MVTKQKKRATSVDSASPKTIVIDQLRTLCVGLEVTGTADLIQNNFSQKSIEQMLKKHMGISVQKESKKPSQVIEQATIRNVANAICVPPTALKSAMLTASTQLKTLKKTQIRTSLFIEGGSIPITYSEMIPRMDIVRTSGMTRTPDVRFRPGFIGWSARMIIQFADTLSVQTVVDLLNRAGTVGIGEWRPEKNGTHGTFRVSRHIDKASEIEEVREECAPPLQRPTIPSWALDADIDPTILSKIFDESNEDQAQERTNNHSRAEA